MTVELLLEKITKGGNFHEEFCFVTVISLRLEKNAGIIFYFCLCSYLPSIYGLSNLM